MESAEYVTPSKAAKLLGDVNASQVRAWAIRGRIRSRRLPSRRWQVLLKDILRVKEGQWVEVEPTAEEKVTT